MHIDLNISTVTRIISILLINLKKQKLLSPDVVYPKALILCTKIKKPLEKRV